MDWRCIGSKWAYLWNDNFENVDGVQALVAEVLATEMDAIDKNIWHGATSSGNFLGIVPQLSATASGAIKTTATASVTYTNVLGEIDKFLRTVPTAVKNGEHRFVISPDIADALVSAQALGQITYGQMVTDTQFKFGRYTLEVVDNLNDRTMLFYNVKNLVLGTGLKSDFNTLFIDSGSSERIKDGTAIIKMVYTAGTAVVRPSEVAIYSPNV